MVPLNKRVVAYIEDELGKDEFEATYYDVKEWDSKIESDSIESVRGFFEHIFGEEPDDVMVFHESGEE